MDHLIAQLQRLDSSTECFALFKAQKNKRCLKCYQTLQKILKNQKRKYQLGLLILILSMQFKNFLLFVLNSIDLFRLDKDNFKKNSSPKLNFEIL